MADLLNGPPATIQRVAVPGKVSSVGSRVLEYRGRTGDGGTRGREWAGGFYLPRGGPRPERWLTNTADNLEVARPLLNAISPLELVSNRETGNASVACVLAIFCLISRLRRFVLRDRPIIMLDCP